MRGSGTLDELMARASLLLKKVKYTRASIAMICGMASGSPFIRMEELTKVCGGVINSTASALKSGKTAPGSRETSQMERNSDSAFTHGVMEQSTKAVGRMERSRVLAAISGLKRNSSQVNG